MKSDGQEPDRCWIYEHLDAVQILSLPQPCIAHVILNNRSLLLITNACQYFSCKHRNEGKATTIGKSVKFFHIQRMRNPTIILNIYCVYDA